MEFTAVSDRILIIQDPKIALHDNPPQTGTIHSIGPSCNKEGKQVKEGDHVVFSRGNHPEQGDHIVIRETQLYAKLP